jgi:16S rRNA (adenine1518-N6/adenine1519-N6)-dimethyltransferase
VKCVPTPMSRSNATTTEAGQASGAGHIARKRFGQNFLHDPGLIHRLVEAIAPTSSDRIVEIGPGQAAITAPLIAKAGSVTAIEIDRDLAAALRQRFDESQLRLLEQDVLRVDFRALSRQLGGPIRVVGNLPYNLSSPILFHLLEAADVIVDQHVMLQKEVVDRMVADCGSKIYGRLSVMLQARYRMARCLRVPPGAFHPAPKVDSAVVRMVPLAAQEVAVSDWFVFSAVVTTAFSQRRKMLRNTLAGYDALIDWSALNILPTQRAEEISVERFIALSNVIARAPIRGSVAINTSAIDRDELS